MISRLRAKRFFAELSIYDLGKLTGIDPARLSLIERDLKTPKDEERERTSQALKCRPDEIFPDPVGGACR